MPACRTPHNSTETHSPSAAPLAHEPPSLAPEGRLPCAPPCCAPSVLLAAWRDMAGRESATPTPRQVSLSPAGGSGAVRARSLDQSARTTTRSSAGPLAAGAGLEAGRPGGAVRAIEEEPNPSLWARGAGADSPAMPSAPCDTSVQPLRLAEADRLTTRSWGAAGCRRARNPGAAARQTGSKRSVRPCMLSARREEAGGYPSQGASPAATQSKRSASPRSSPPWPPPAARALSPRRQAQQQSLSPHGSLSTPPSSGRASFSPPSRQRLSRLSTRNPREEEARGGGAAEAWRRRGGRGTRQGAELLLTTSSSCLGFPFSSWGSSNRGPAWGKREKGSGLVENRARRRGEEREESEE
eukprot:scaffold205959_cov24-Tisochrysis_lutea.AAC.1